ncbi:MAG: hypothetical protein A2W99_10300 [Bacteroidetes bacterium GWF2_33_16]|nr:MAG: hypothetical protein A2X00_05440 [Bacteroidetes bacterium GWE2_32_14]OFY03939.1 MAG: hypothetical protein A2W99_10300 [Bacteroidetes bacterium GWF2_33_16]
MKKKNIFKRITLLAIAFVAILSSCVDNDYDIPAIKEIPVGNMVSIAQLKTYFTDSGAVYINSAVGTAYEFKKDISIYGTITMDDKSGNLYKMAYIQDVTGAIALKFDAAGGIQAGDTVRINVNGLVINQYAKAFQINAIHGAGFKKGNYITTIDVSKPRNPEIATISQIIGDKDKYQGRLVKIEGAQFVAGDTMQYYADYTNSISRDLNIEQGASTLVVRTSGYANFADEKSPKGSGSIIGVLGQYNSTMQLQIRSTDEVVMTDERIGGGGGSGTGAGTFDDPYDVAAGISNQGQTAKWVEGYLVGVYETTVDPFAPSFTAPFATNSNVIIAASAAETNIANCIVVQVPSGDIRTAVNLVDNPTNKGKVVKFKGNLETYFGGPGLKTVNGYWMDGTGINPEEPISVVVLGTSITVASLDEAFTGATANTNFSASGWLNANKQGERYWQGKEFNSNKYVQATSYNATSSVIESWLVTPGVTLTTPKKLNFDSATGYYNHAGLTVWVSTNFDGNNANLFTATWTQINPTIAVGPANAYSDFVNSGDVNLSAYSGTIYILFKYLGNNTTQTTTFQIDNVKIIDL